MLCVAGHDLKLYRQLKLFPLRANFVSITKNDPHLCFTSDSIVTWRMPSSETTSRRPIWLSSERCRGTSRHTFPLYLSSNSDHVQVDSGHGHDVGDARAMNLRRCAFVHLAAGYFTCSSRARPVRSSGPSVPWCWAAWPWAPRTTSSPWWTVTSSLPFFKVGKHTRTHTRTHARTHTHTLPFKSLGSLRNVFIFQRKALFFQ